MCACMHAVGFRLSVQSGANVLLVGRRAADQDDVALAAV